MAPKVEFEVSKIVNEFCHLSVLYSDLMPLELAEGILQNKAYHEKHRGLRQDKVRFELQKTGPFTTAEEWYWFATGLMSRDQYGRYRSMCGNSSFVEVFRERHQRGDRGFEEIWDEVMPRLLEYQYSFSRQWSQIGARVLLRLQELTKTVWETEQIPVHYIDCIYGGFGWDNCIGLTPVPDLEVQKKLLTHELSELLTPHSIIARELHRAGLDPGITHTVVDMLAYFSASEFLARTDPQGQARRGMKPNPSYYPAASVLFPFFERYADDPSIYPDFESVVKEMNQTLLHITVSSKLTTV